MTKDVDKQGKSFEFTSKVFAFGQALISLLTLQNQDQGEGIFCMHV